MKHSLDVYDQHKATDVDAVADSKKPEQSSTLVRIGLRLSSSKRSVLLAIRHSYYGCALRLRL